MAFERTDTSSHGIVFSLQDGYYSCVHLNSHLYPGLWRNLLLPTPSIKKKKKDCTFFFLEALKVQITPSDWSKCSQMGWGLRMGGVGLLINAFQCVHSMCFPHSSDADWLHSLSHLAFGKSYPQMLPGEWRAQCSLCQAITPLGLDFAMWDSKEQYVKIYDANLWNPQAAVLNETEAAPKFWRRNE